MKLAYDGTRYHGWQIQPQKRTVQKSLQYALMRFAHKRIEVTGSGRTDTGVHAKGQAVHFDYTGSASPDQVRLGLRKYLPDDIQVISIVQVKDDFHARYDACLRHYQYLIAKSETPFNRFYMGSFPRKKITYTAMQTAATHFIGEYDFSSFSKPNPAVPDHVCQVTQSMFEEREDHYIYTIKATRFLHNMVRRIVGSMINISHLELSPEIIRQWLEERNPRQTIIYPAPPQGLYLMDVTYPVEKLVNS
jgi:tRNA pseudouridine38-40 synthase